MTEMKIIFNFGEPLIFSNFGGHFWQFRLNFQISDLGYEKVEFYLYIKGTFFFGENQFWRIQPVTSWVFVSV